MTAHHFSSASATCARYSQENLRAHHGKPAKLPLASDQRAAAEAAPKTGAVIADTAAEAAD